MLQFVRISEQRAARALSMILCVAQRKYKRRPQKERESTRCMSDDDITPYARAETNRLHRKVNALVVVCNTLAECAIVANRHHVEMNAFSRLDGSYCVAFMFN